MMKILGKITKVGSLELVGKNQVEKMTVVVQELGDSQYPNSLAIDFLKEKTKDAQSLNEGDTVEIEYNTRATEYNGRIYNNISAWKVSSKSSGSIVKDDDAELPF